MRLLDLVEQHDLVGPAPHRLGQRAAFLVADIARRRADQAGDRVLLHVLGHVDAHERRVVVEQEAGERLGQLGLADARGAEEHERADRPVRVLQPGPGAPDRGRDRLHRLPLADDALGQRLLHGQQLLALALQHLVHRHAGPARDHAATWAGVTASSIMPSRPPGLRLDLGELLLQPRDHPVGELTRALVLALALGRGQLVARLVELLLEAGGRAELVLLGLPPGGDRRRALLEIGQLLLQADQPVARGGIGLLLERLGLDLEPHDLAVDRIELFRLRIDLHAQARAGLVDQVDRLVGQEPVGDVAVRERRRPPPGPNPGCARVVLLVLLLQAAQDRGPCPPRSAPTRRPAGSGGRARRPSRRACGTRPAWSRRRSAARAGERGL